MKDLFRVLIFVFIIVLLFKNNKQKIDFNNYKQIKETEFTEYRNKINQSIIKQEALVLHDKEVLNAIIDSLTKSNIKLKNTKSYVNHVSKIEIRDTFVKYDSIIVSTNNDTLKCVNINDPWVDVDICSNDSGLNINNISFNDTTSVVISNHGFLKNKSEVTIVNNNPYKNTTSVNSVIIKEKKNYTLLKYSIGITIAVILLVL